MRELLHPPEHRGPLIAAGAVVLVVGVALLLVRYASGPGTVFAVTGALAVVLLWLALQGATAGPPPAFASVLIVAGLAACAFALGSLADLLTDTPDSGSAAWVAAAVAGLAAWCSGRRSSAVAALIAAVAGGVALLALWDEVFSPDGVTPFRWLLLALMIGYAIASLALRGTSRRHAEQMVNAAGASVLAIPLLEPFSPHGAFWELIVLAAGLGLVAYAAADRAPGAAYLGAANLAAFVYFAGFEADALLWWPLLLIAVGAVMLLAGLRPRVPLPPEPETSIRPDDTPLTIRSRRD